jgi:hypothetical protein
VHKNGLWKKRKLIYTKWSFLVPLRNRQLWVSAELLQPTVLCTAHSSVQNTEVLCVWRTRSAIKEDRSPGLLILNVLERIPKQALHTPCCKWRSLFHPPLITSKILIVPEGCGNCFWVLLTLSTGRCYPLTCDAQTALLPSGTVSWKQTPTSEFVLRISDGKFCRSNKRQLSASI